MVVSLSKVYKQLKRPNPIVVFLKKLIMIYEKIGWNGNWEEIIPTAITNCDITKCKISLRWFETVFYFPLQLNFMKGLLICSKRLLLVVDSRCCNNLSTYKLLYSHWHFGCHGNLTGPQIHPISSVQLHFTHYKILRWRQNRQTEFF